MRARATLPILAALLGTLAGGPACAQDADPCARFDWSLAREQGWFAADLPVLASGAELPADRPAARLALEPSEAADLPRAPSRAAKPGTYSGYVRVPAAATAGLVQVTLSGEGWIDVSEADGAPGRPVAHTGKHGCATLRKSVRYAVGAQPLVVSISNAPSETVAIAVAPAAP